MSTLVPTLGWGQAVSVDSASLMRRLENIEKRLRLAEVQGGTTSAAKVSAGTYSVVDLDRRMGDLETEMGQNSGKVENAQNALERLSTRIDAFIKDVDMRLNALEASTQRLSERPVAAAVETRQAGTPIVTAAGGTVSKSAVDESKIVVPEGLAATDLYNRAYAYLAAAEYAQARVWMETFLQRFPKDKLADNAWYWLGEIQLVENNPSGAVVSFKNGIQNFPKGAKMPANLLKMGVALEQMGKGDLAKGTWEKLVKDFPSSPEAARAKEKMLGLKG